MKQEDLSNLERNLHEKAIKYATEFDDRAHENIFNEHSYKSFMAGARAVIALSAPIKKQLEQMMSPVEPAPQESRL